jgi:acyl carrier protein
MNKKKFTEDFANQFQDINVRNVRFQMEFRQLPTWDSLTGMAVLAMIHDNYKVDISPDDFRNLRTIEDVYNYVVNKLAH